MSSLNGLLLQFLLWSVVAWGLMEAGVVDSDSAILVALAGIIGTFAWARIQDL